MSENRLFDFDNPVNTGRQDEVAPCGVFQLAPFEHTMDVELYKTLEF